MGRVSPLLFQTAFSLAPYPSLAGRPIFQLYFGLHPQGFAVSSASRATSTSRHHRFNAVRSRFCARAGALAPHPFRDVCVSSGGGTFHTGQNWPAAAALPLSPDREPLPSCYNLRCRSRAPAFRANLYPITRISSLDGPRSERLLLQAGERGGL